MCWCGIYVVINMLNSDLCCTVCIICHCSFRSKWDWCTNSQHIYIQRCVFKRVLHGDTGMVSFGSHDSPGSTFADSSLIVSLFVVQLIVGTVFAFGSSCNHRPWLIPITRLSPCCVPWGCTKKKGERGKLVISIWAGGSGPWPHQTLINGLCLNLNNLGE